MMVIVNGEDSDGMVRTVRLQTMVMTEQCKERVRVAV